jgi:zinc protease
MIALVMLCGQELYAKPLMVAQAVIADQPAVAKENSNGPSSNKDAKSTEPADDPLAALEKVIELEGITEYRLSNGVKVLLFPDNSKPQFTINVTVNVGSRHEGYGESGMAHLLEHMLFKGTDKYPDTPKWLKDRGVLNMNGTTWLDRTNYYETLPASDDNLEFAIEMEADRLVNSWIRGEDLNSEMTVVRNEFERGENSPQRILMQRIVSTGFDWHNYGKSTIGNRSDIERVPVDRLRQFYKKYYQPDNITVVMAGKFDTETTLGLIRKYFGALEAPDRELPKTYTEEPAQDGQRRVELRRAGDVHLVGVGYHVPAASNEDYAAVEVLVNLLGNQPDGPLYEALVKSELASDVYSFAFKTHDPGMMMVLAEISEDADIGQAEEVMLSTVQSVAETGITEERVKREIQGILQQRERLFANSEQFAIQLSEWQAYGDWRLFFLHRDRIEKVTVEDVKAAAKKYLVTDNRTVGVFLPTKETQRAPLPDRVDLESLLADYEGREAIAQGESFDPTPENIDARSETGQFDSGVKYVFLPKKTRGEKVFVNGKIHFGSPESLSSKIEASEMMGSLINRGTESYDYQAFRDRLNELGATLSVGSQVGELTFRIEAKRNTLQEVLVLLKSALREPKFDSQEFEILRRQKVTSIESGLSEPNSLAGNLFSRKLSPYEKTDARYAATLPEQIENLKALTVDDIKGVYSQVSGSYGEVAIVGDFEPADAKEILNSTFADWDSSTPYVRIEEPAVEGIVGERVTINTPDKANAVYLAGYVKPMKDSDEDYEALLVGNYVLGGGPLSSRLADRVRKQDGLSYTVGSQYRADTFDDQAVFTVYAISNPENTEKVANTIVEEIERLLEGGIKDDEFEKAKESYLTKRKGGRADDRGLAGLLRKNLEADRTMAFFAQSDQEMQSLTKVQVEEALRKFVSVDDLVIVTAGDFESLEKDDQPPSGKGE